MARTPGRGYCARVTTSHADLAPLTLPNDEAGWHDWLVERCDDQLERARDLVEQLRTRDGADAAAILEHWNRVATALSNAA